MSQQNSDNQDKNFSVLDDSKKQEQNVSKAITVDEAKKVEIDDFDPAQQSLSDALRVSFLVLKVVMIIAVIAYLCSGIFQVSEHDRALRLRFGKIVGQPGQQVYGPGWHFGLPYPIEQVIRVSTQPRTININSDYWYAGSKAEQGQNQPLDPIKDGSLLTGDANIVHARFQVIYHVSDPVEFERNIVHTRRGDEVVTAVAKQAIVSAVSQSTADSVIRGNANQNLAQSFLQKSLNNMEAGLKVDNVILSDKSMPQAVHKAYQAVINANNQRAKAINDARKQRTQILGGAAGEAGLPQGNGNPSPLVALMDKYEFAYQAGDKDKAKQLNKQLDNNLTNLAIKGADGLKISIGGKVASIINEAKSYGDKVQQEVLAQSNNFNKLFAEYKKNPRILADRLWQNAKGKIFTGDVETFYTLPGKPYIVINRSPKVQNTLRKKALESAKQAAKAQAANSQQ